MAVEEEDADLDLPFEESAGFFEAIRRLQLKKSQERTMRSIAEKEGKLHSFTKEDVVEGRAKKRPIVGTLLVSDLVAINLASHCKRSPYFYLAFEAHRHKSARMDRFFPEHDLNALQSKLKMRNFPYKHGKELFYWGETFTFPVTDVAADLKLDLYASKPVGAVIASRTDICVGTVIIPLSQILAESSVRLSAANTVRRCEGWFELYPLPAGHLCYTPVVKGLPGTGLQRPEKLLGRVFCKVELRLTVPVVDAFARTTPYRPLLLKVPEKADARFIKGADNRIKAMFAAPPYFVVLLRKIRRWENKALSSCAALAWAFMVYVVAWWQLPFFFALLVVIVGFMAKGQQNREKIQVFNDEIDPDPNHPDTIVKKLRVLFKLLAKLQKASNLLASFMERLCNAFNWTDERVSLSLSIVLLVAGAVLSCIGKGVDVIIDIVSLEHFIFTVGMLCLVPLPKALLARSAATSTPENETPNPDEATSTKMKIPMAQRLKNVLLRIPDEIEYTHREIAKQQQIEFYVE